MKPKIFIASSVEGLNVANTIQEGLEYDAEVTVWDQDVFQLSSNTLDDLNEALSTTDFGIFVFTPDDTVNIRGNEAQFVRDNVIFELGMFIGKLGKKRCFIVSPRTQEPFRIPTDLLGVTPATYNPNRDDGKLSAALGPACNKIRQTIENIQRIQQSTEPQDTSEQKQTFNELMRALDSPTLSLQENAIKDDLKNRGLTEPEAIEVLIRYLANAQITLVFNEIDQKIWGSQVELLQHLNSSPGSSAEELRTFYNLAVYRSTNPEEFIKYTFEQYLQFLTSRELITNLAGSYFISQLGRDFLIFLTAKGAPQKIL
ncbi:MAG: nucleotide-binding protein [Candidatus Poribacteria bacterium]|nr:nucleotide-binding protein [Candidatus Poribacteria bacterium]